MKRDLAALPKAELHIHLEGAMRYETLGALSSKYGLAVPPDTRGQRFPDFGAFVQTYVTACECLREESDLFRLVLEVAQDAAASGALWIEPALSIEVYSERFGGTLATLEILMRAAEAAERATGVGIGFIVAAERHFPVPQAEALAQIVREQALSKKLLINGRFGVVGFGLHGSEAGFPPAPFENAFKIACEGTGIASVPHGGEIPPAPNKGAASVAGCCSVLKCKRIGHGVLASEDETVLKDLADSGVCLDCCPTSNYLLSVVPSFSEHPLPKMIAKGVVCTINSDDPLLFGGNLLGEFEVCRKDLRMNDATLAGCAKASFENSCAPAEVRKKGIEGIGKWLHEKRPIKLRKPKWSKVEKINPKSTGINLMLKCLSCKEVNVEGGPSRIWEATVGDDSGVVILQLRSEELTKVCEAGASLRMQNARSVMIKGFIRVAVDKWAVLKRADEEVNFEPKASNNISEVEFELV